jgi:ATP-dependent DNA ligase
MSDYSIPKAIDIDNMAQYWRSSVEEDILDRLYLITPKRDGCALHVEMENGQIITCVSASGKPVCSVQHILEELQRVFKHVSCAVLDMEVYADGLPFQGISGLFRRHKPQPQLRAMVFNGHFGQLSTGYEGRMSMFGQYLTGKSNLVEVTPPHTPWDLADAWAEAVDRRDSGGFDGCVLHYKGAPYFTGRAAYQSIKLKPLVSHDLEVIAVNEAVGEKTGRATCALVCRWKDGGVQEVATGLSHGQQASALDFIGKIIEVRGMGYTTSGKIREPRFAGVREDKLQPDY